ncbi:MAG: FAD-dependent oxidoreductase [Verrucomicrobia bacterium]|nr:FAD-dependent oxidoreductase [Verrucomicrobiota bacterium]
MAEHETFHYRSLADLSQRIQDLKLDLEVSEDLTPLFQPLQAGPYALPNRFVALPMEGCDGLADGSPDELTYRRYRRFAAGGAGLLWFEATAVVHEGRANPRQLWLHEPTVPAFAKLVEGTLKAGQESLGAAHRPLLIVQLTHSGRYSRPGRTPAPIIAHHSPFLDPTHKLPPDYPLIADAELERLEDCYVAAARCARQAGFDGVDVKACHRYLVSELHASFTRENSRYGGPAFENRSRFFRNVVAKIRAAVPDLLVTSRMNVFDAMAYPYGFGMDRENPAQADLAEPLELVRFLKKQGAPLVNITIGNPYFNPHINRPFDQPTAGAPVPPEHPLVGVDRFVRLVREIQQAMPDLAVIGGGYSWLRQYLPYVAAANLRRGWVSLVGLGRMAFAYPDCVRDLQITGKFNPRKACVACSSCTQIMRDGGRTGCVPRDAKVYAPIYKQGRAEAPDTIMGMAKTCRQCNDPTCVGDCPAGVNIPKFVGAIAEGKFREAYQTLREANTLAVACGYVCPSAVQCEAGCIKQHDSFSVPIRHLQRWVGRKALDEGWAAEPRPSTPPSGQRVAVIGAGPAGIAAAEKLAEFGHAVTVFERVKSTGGAAREVIPAVRLPEPVIEREIQAVLAAHQGRITLRHAALDARFTLDHLFEDGFNAVLLAAGLGQSLPLPHAARPRTGVEGALSFLARMKQGEWIPGLVVLVLGGGNSAIDAATCAKEAGADDVSIVYRRSFAEMPAWPQERDHAIAADIHFLTLTAPLDYIADEAGCLTGLKVIRTRLGAPDAGGRRRPEPLPGTEHVLPAGLVIEALGQMVSEDLKAVLPGVRFTENGLVWSRADTFQTSRPGVFVAGDMLNGGTTVVRAVAEGIRAARQMDESFRAEPVPIRVI